MMYRNLVCNFQGRTSRRWRTVWSTLFVLGLLLSAEPVLAQALDVAWSVRYVGRTPTVQAGLSAENLGNGRYRVAVQATADDEWDAYVDYQVINAFGAVYRVTGDFAPGAAGGDVSIDANIASIGPHVVEAEAPFQVSLVAGQDGVEEYSELRNFNAPEADQMLQYFFDVEDDGDFEVTGGGQNFVEFEVPAGTANVTISGFVRGSGGDDSAFSEVVALRNDPPVFELARLIAVDQHAFEVVASASAVDPDGDDIEYVFEWGDGSLSTENTGGIAVHEYPDGEFDDYVLTIRARDGRGGEDTAAVQVSFPAPGANQAPAFQTVQIIELDAFDLTIAASAQDPDDDVLTYRFNWGDGSADLVNDSGLAAHTFPDGVFGAYVVTVTVTDGQGGSSTEVVVVTIEEPPEPPEPPANVAPTFDFAEVIRDANFEVVVAVNAVDADGDDLTYTFNWDDGTSSSNAGGVGTHTYDIRFRDYTITIEVSDGNGGTDVTTLEVSYPEPPPNQRPSIELAELVQKDGFDVVLAVSATDADDDLVTYVFDWGDGSLAEPNGGGVASHSFPEDVFDTYTVTITASDGRGGFDMAQVIVDFPEPAANQGPSFDLADIINRDGFSITVAANATDPDNDALTYTFDWGDGTAPTINAAGVAAHAYPVAVYEAYTVTITVDDGRGATAETTLELEFEEPPEPPEPPANNAPVFDLADEIERNGFDVVVVASATDADGDAITYTFDWGDGSADTVSNAAVASHVYAEDIYRTYTVTITADDGRGGSDHIELDIDFPEPAENQAPAFDLAEVINEDGFSIVVAAHAVDPDGDSLSYTISWGDGSADVTNGSGVATHTYAEVYQAYAIRIVVSDGQGGTASTDLAVDFPEPGANRAPAFDLVQEIGRDGFEVSLAASATDADGDDLSYSFDWGDGSALTETAGGIATHQYPEGVFDSYTVNVTVTDGHGGVSVEQIEVRFPIPAANEAPVFELAEVAQQDGFNIMVAANAVDADGDVLTYTFDWGDGSPVSVAEGGVAAHAYPENVFRAYTVTVVVEDGRGGRDETRVELDFPAPAENQFPSFEMAQIIRQDGFEVVVAISATDPDEDELTYVFDWGDGSDIEETSSAVALHRFPDGVYQGYVVVITVFDSRGGEEETSVLVDFPEPPANEPPAFELLQLIDREGFGVAAAASAVDPDGDVLTYTFSWGDDSADDANQAGVAEHTYPVDVYRAYTITVAADDGRGGHAEAQLEIDFPAPQPNRAPVLDLARIIRQTGFEVVAAASATDADGDDLTYTFDWGDGSDAMTNAGGVGVHNYPDEVYAGYVLTITVRDEEGAEDSTTILVDFPEPPPNRDPSFELLHLIDREGFAVSAAASAVDPDGDELTYHFDWGDGTDPVAVAGGIAEHEYPIDVYVTYTLVVTVEDGRGGSAEHSFEIDFPPPPANQPPTIEELRVVKQEGWEVTAVVGGVDPDGDDLTYTIDWGDGSAQTVRAVGLAAHSFPEGVYTTYTVTAIVNDGRGGVAQARIDVVYPPPPPNQPPVVEEVDVQVGPRGAADIAVVAWDPEGQQLAWSVHWGDEADDNSTLPLPGGTGEHGYALPEDGSPYVGFVLTTDTEGGVTRTAFAVSVVDRPTLIREVNATVIRDGLSLIRVVAEDGDGSGFLTYAFDFDDDGVFEEQDRADNSALNTYAEAGEYTIRVRVTDTWSGASVETTTELDVPEWVPDDWSPEIREVGLSYGPAGAATLQIDAFDPEGGPLDYLVHWGDEFEADAVEALVGSNGDHQYAFTNGVPYGGYVVVRDILGQEARTVFSAEIADHPTTIRSVSHEHLREGTHRVTVVARDDDALLGLTYSFDFDGDGVWELSDVAQNSANFDYEQPGVYMANVGVRDPWSGLLTETDLRIEVAPWIPENQPPIIDELDVAVGTRGHTVLSLEVRDPDGGDIDVFVHWGDEAQPGLVRQLVGFRGEHDYAYRGVGWPYNGHVRIVDSRGSEVLRPFIVQVNDHLTEIREVNTQRVREGVWLFDVQADDPDGSNGLLYSFDFTDDGIWDISDQLGNSTVHTYPVPGLYSVRIGVTDPWSGVTVEEVIQAGRDPEGGENLPPVIHDVSLQQSPGGAVEIVVEATDPEQGLLEAEVDWGDAGAELLEVIEGLRANHTYAYPADGAPFQGIVRVRDPHGLQVEQEFDVWINDSPTVIRGISMTVLRHGQVQFSVSASDPDTDTLTYSFDMDGDGLYDALDLIEGELLYTYRTGGAYTAVVSITDTWSGVVTEVEQVLYLEKWIEEAPVAGDHLEGEEGRCLVLRVSDGEVSAQPDTSICDRDVNPNADRWRWDFGDGTVARGSEVGHRYQDDGVYVVTVTGGTAEQPIISAIEVFVANVAPSFVSQPADQASAGSSYLYPVLLDDQGPEDEINLQLVDGPAGMELEELRPREWALTWDVPGEEFGQHSVQLRAQDGRMVDGEWVPDDGETTQRYTLNVDGPLEVDAGPPPPDAGPPSFDDYTGDSLGCTVSHQSSGGAWLIMLTALMLGLGLRRKHH